MIVERLRGEHRWLNVSGDEAADAIEQWQGRCEALRRAAVAQEAEIDRLRADFVAQLDVASRRAVEMQAEIERLLAVCKDKAELLKHAYTDIDRLRDALRLIVSRYETDGDAAYMAVIARRALEGK